MSTPALVLLEGLFYESGGVFFTQGDDAASIGDKLAPLVGRSIQASLSHRPPTPAILDAPGLGCCMWAGYCPSGHVQNPSWLFSASYRGVLEASVEGTDWSVGGEVIPLRSMLGHTGLLVLFADGQVDPDSSVGDLLAEAEGLAHLLNSLKNELS